MSDLSTRVEFDRPIYGATPTQIQCSYCGEPIYEGDSIQFWGWYPAVRHWRFHNNNECALEGRRVAITLRLIAGIRDGNTVFN